MSALSRSQLGLLFGSFALALLGWQAFTYTVVIFARSLTGSDAMTGTIFLCLMAPTLLLTLYAGAVADRSSKHRILRQAQWSLVACTALLTMLVATANGTPDVIWLLGAVTMIGVVSSFTGPSRMAMIPSLFEKGLAEKLTVYVALINYVCIAVGPAMAGALKTVLPWHWLFAAVAILYALSTVLLSRVPPDLPPTTKGGRRSMLAEVKEGLSMMVTHRVLGQVTLYTAFVSMFVLGPLQVLAPEYLKQQLALTEQERGLFVGSFGVGILLGGAAGVALLSRPARGLVIASCSLLAIAAFLLFAQAQGPILTAAGLIACGAGVGSTMALGSATMQSLSAAEHRGRTMSILSLIILGLPAAAGQLAALLAQITSLRTALTVTPCVGIVAVLLLTWLARQLRDYRAAPASHETHDDAQGALIASGRNHVS